MPIIEVSTRLRFASALNLARAWLSLIAGGSSSGRSVRIASGAVRSISSSSEPTPTTSSIAAISASSGPICRPTKAGASSSANERVVMVAFLASGLLRSALALDEGAVGCRVHQGVELGRVGDLEFAEPAGALGVAIDQCRVFGQGGVHLDHLAADRGINV